MIIHSCHKNLPSLFTNKMCKQKELTWKSNEHDKKLQGLWKHTANRKFLHDITLPFLRSFALSKYYKMFLRTASAMTARDIKCIGRLSLFQDEHASLAIFPSHQHTFKHSHFDIFISFLLFQEIKNPATEVISKENVFEITLLESSDKALCMKPFKEHPKTLVANAERWVLGK